MTQRTVLVTGANGYIGNAVAKAFRRAGWKVYGLVRQARAVGDLARHEIHPVIGTPEDLSFLDRTDGVVFDVVVSNTEDMKNAAAHLAKVKMMMDTIVRRSEAAGVRPLVMFSSGCKDYGIHPAGAALSSRRRTGLKSARMSALRSGGWARSRCFRGWSAAGAGATNSGLRY